MRLRRALAAGPAVLALAAMPAPLAAEPWEQVAELPGGIAVEVDANSVFEALDGVRLVLRATFRRQLPTATMETAVAVDCARAEAKIRGVRLLDGETVMSENVSLDSEFAPVREGSAEDIYFQALCEDGAEAGEGGQ